MDFFGVIIWLAITIIAGWSVLSIALYKRGDLFFGEKIALSYGMGLGLISIEMALLSVFKIRFSAFSIAVFWVPLVAAGFAMRSKNILDENKASFVEKLFIFGILFEVLYVFFRALIQPIESYDAIAIYAIKAKIFYMAGAIPGNFFTAFKDIVPHIEYPLLVPLSETSLFAFIGNLNDLLVKIIFPLYYCAILAAFYYIARREVNRKTALLFTFLLATVSQFNEYATNGYADLPLAFYYSASVFFAYLWVRKKEPGFIIVSAIFSVLCIWTKTEGLALAGINALLVASYAFLEKKRILWKGLLYASFILAAVIIYLFIMKKILGLSVNGDFAKVNLLDFGRMVVNLKRLPLILYEYQIQFFGPKKWNIIWVIFLVLFFINFKLAFKKELRFLTLSILLVLGAYTGIYIITPQDVAWHLSTTASRLFIHFLPVVVLWCAIIFKELKLEI